MEPMEGRLIVFEGVEGCGKTTQLLRSQTWLLNHPIVQRLQAKQLLSQLLVTREPGGTEVGKAIRQLLLNPTTPEPIHSQAELLLYAADRAHHVESYLRPNLEAGALVLCDRYTDSTLAYQGYGRGLNLDLIHQLNQIATNGLESHLTLWLDLDVEVGLARTQKRGVADRMEQSSLDFHRRVQSGFAALAETYPHRIVRVNANGSEDDVFQQICFILERTLQQWFPGCLETL